MGFNNPQGVVCASHRCLVCGKPLKMRQSTCCSDDCMKKLVFRLAAGDKRYRVCPICNKVYTAGAYDKGLCPGCRTAGKEMTAIG